MSQRWEKIWCISVSIGCIIEQSIAIFVVSVTLKNHISLFIMSIIVNGIIILCGIFFIWYAIKNERVLISFKHIVDANEDPQSDFRASIFNFLNRDSTIKDQMGLHIVTRIKGETKATLLQLILMVMVVFILKNYKQYYLI